MNLITTGTLKDRGWTEFLIKRFLGEPDQLTSNPRYRSAAPMRLFALDRVEQAEASAAFAAAKAVAARRSDAGKKAAQAKADALLVEIRAMPITVERLGCQELLEAAIAAYNGHQGAVALERDTSRTASADADQEFLDRIQVNFVRHRLTKYDEALEAVAGRAGAQDAVDLIRDRVYLAIADAYPYLALECDRQLQRRMGVMPW